jgi:glutamate dehydrogenase
MSLNLEENRLELIQKIDKMIDQKINLPEAGLVKAFLDQFYLGVASYDLRNKSVIDLYGALLSIWHFLYQRKPGESKVRVYNPQIEQNGWQSTHTIIEVIHENKPFLLDSLRLALHKLDIDIHLIIHAEGIRFMRDASGIIQSVLPIDDAKNKNTATNVFIEAPIYIEIDRQTDAQAIEKIINVLKNVLIDVDLMVRDWTKMLQKVKSTQQYLEKQSNEKNDALLNEVISFLRWLTADHFTFIGYAEYDFVAGGKGPGLLQYVIDSGLGVLTQTNNTNLTRDLANMYPDARDMYLNDEILLLGKTDTISTVHRSAYTDFVTIKLFDKNHKLQKVLRFIGLYTSVVYHESPEEIPFVRKKIDHVFAMTKFPKASHDGKALSHIIATLPRDELFLARDNEIFDFALGILHMQERQKLRLFMRRDIFGRYFSCLVFLPREIFSSHLRMQMQNILMEQLNGESVTFESKFSESVLARVHFIIRVNPLEKIAFDQNDIEQRLIEAARSWTDELKVALLEHWGEEKTNELLKKYFNAFPLSYSEAFSARNAVIDIEHIENMNKYDDNHLEMGIYRPAEDPEDSFRFKLFRKNKAIPLSDIVPILERMGLKIISEQPHEIKLADKTSIWINDYRMITPNGKKLVTEEIQGVFEEAFAAIWHGNAENDSFNSLVLAANLNWRDVSILRAIYRYLWQIGLMFSQSTVEDALYNNIAITRALINYFYTKFDPNKRPPDPNAKLLTIKKDIEAKLEDVASLNEDRIIRSFLGTMHAMVRTNYFQYDLHGKYKGSCSYKFDSTKVPDLPLPKPMCEIFVYSPRVEGIHLRADKIARGGIRLSDRHEDFRTEVLGLMKTQQVKNAVIVPLGAKGGFIVKKDLQTLPDKATRNSEIVNCYQIFIRGLLDVTDNYKDNGVVKPKDTICWDQDDPYLVVAADKGTATFSDLANAIAKEYNFWLNDAFASGGSAGYDHKKMGITARGAWESVKMHFQKFNIDVQKQSITVFGVGDMAGDVFGNGMLLSDKIKLIAAFNHVHIFFDPNPDPALSYAERRRLFNLPGSSWSDYDPKLISTGGGVFDRAAKKIMLSPQMQQVLDTKAESMLPNELIRAILMMPVDLFFNGGIGTFVKAEYQRNVDVGDRANDAIRINGNQLRCRVVCEGGNLGFTQLGRIEYAKNGGLINTDAIDNSGGVNCSDNEVNIKVLLNEVVASDDMTEKQRNELLVNMTNEVAGLVLANNRKQNEALSLAEYQAAANIKMHYRLQQDLQRTAGLDPEVEYLPGEKELAARISAELGFTRPEIAVLMAYTKIQLKRELLNSTVPDDNHVTAFLINYFPKALQDQKYSTFMQKHRLKRNIIATQISNTIVDEMGINFIQRLAEESGANSPDIARAYLIARETFDAANMRNQIRELGVKVPNTVQITMLQDLNRLIRRATRWFLCNRHGELDIAKIITLFKPKVLELQNNLENFLKDSRLEKLKEVHSALNKVGVPDPLAKSCSKFSAMFAALDIVEAALENNSPVLDMAQVYFELGNILKLGWFGEMISKQPVNNNWEALARAGFRDDVDKQQRNLSLLILRTANGTKDLVAYTDKWFKERQNFMNRWEFFINELKSSNTDFTMFAIALRELLDMAQAMQ